MAPAPCSKCMPQGLFVFFFPSQYDMIYAKAMSSAQTTEKWRGEFTHRDISLIGSIGRQAAPRNTKGKFLLKMNVITLIIIYLAVVNFISFTVMGIDKLKARKRAWRIPEATLFVLAIIGGSAGSIIGMHLFRHKTRHWYFLYGMPAILAVQILIVVALLSSPIEFLIL